MDMNDSIRAGLDSFAVHVAEGVAEIKPRLRGWLHLASAPVTLANLPPHGEAPVNITFNLPDKVAPGVYDIGLTETAPEGTAVIRYGGKITIAP